LVFHFSTTAEELDTEAYDHTASLLHGSTPSDFFRNVFDKEIRSIS